MEPPADIGHHAAIPLVTYPLSSDVSSAGGSTASGGAGSAGVEPGASTCCVSSVTGREGKAPSSSEKPCKRLPKVATSYPFRVHVLRRTDGGDVPECGCGHQHMVYGDTYQYCTCGLAAKQPICDGTCKSEAPGFEPLELKCDKQQTYYLLCGWCVGLRCLSLASPSPWSHSF